MKPKKWEVPTGSGLEEGLSSASTEALCEQTCNPLLCAAPRTCRTSEVEFLLWTLFFLPSISQCTVKNVDAFAAVPSFGLVYFPFYKYESKSQEQSATTVHVSDLPRLSPSPRFWQAAAVYRPPVLSADCCSSPQFCLNRNVCSSLCCQSLCCWSKADSPTTGQEMNSAGIR